MTSAAKPCRCLDFDESASGEGKILAREENVKILTIKDMQDYYDRIHSSAAHINRGALESFNPDIRDGKIKLPDTFACVSDGKVLTWEDVKQHRRERQREILEYKRSPDNETQIRHLYVWVFWCPGISGIFRGWYLYLIGHGFRGDQSFRHDDMQSRIMELFPLVEKPLFDKPDFEKWMQEFVKHYRRGTWCGKPQGKALILAKVKNSWVTEIICREEWPRPWEEGKLCIK